MNLLKQLKNYLFSFIIPSVILFVSTIIYSRVFQPSEYGEYILVISVIGLIASIISHGFQQSIVRFYSGAKSEEKKKIVNSTFYYFIIILVISLTSLMVLSFFVDKANPYYYYLLPTFFYLLLTISLGFIQNIYQASAETGKYFFLSTFPLIIGFGFTIFLLLLEINNPIIILISNTVGYALTLVISITKIKKDNIIVISFATFDKNYFIQILKYSVPLGLFTVSTFLINIIDRFFLNYLVGADATGIYSSNYSFFNGTLKVLLPIIFVFTPYLYSSWNKKLYNIANNLLVNIIKIYFVCSLIFIILISIFIKYIYILLIGKEFLLPFSELILLAVGLIFSQVTLLTIKPLEFNKQVKLISLITLSILFLNILLNFIFIPFLGIYGSILATLFSYVCLYCIQVSILIKNIKDINLVLTPLMLIILSVCIIFVEKFSEDYFIILCLCILFSFLLFISPIKVLLKKTNRLMVISNENNN
ncbi:hypothetical protein EVU96_12630 [Bacillus infantis]|uniref:lipopolysaccharide biosynthesis protein n=1 Tax=Bacillus infantis TaxID=324767 RepID=UPI00101C2BFB|nr:oligosaccharide flippase family protein [Bacillus infantis]RYI28773.1 hypothetical protein EVU96_12630 [Bacillus infantis]